jgi:ATP-dependent exoDNAse (exonuclease V) alpha subunit
MLNIGDVVKVKLMNGQIGVGKLLEFDNKASSVTVQWYYSQRDISNSLMTYESKSGSASFGG